MNQAAECRPRPAWLNSAASWALVLFGWSLPASLFGMQAALVAGVLCLLALGLSTRGANLLRSPLDGSVLALLVVIGLSLLFAPGGVTSFRTATSFWVVAAFYLTWLLLDSERTLSRALVGLLVLACLASGLGVFQSFTGQYPLFEWFHPDVNPDLRLVPVSGRPGAVGFFFSRLTFAHVLLFPFCWMVGLLLEPLGRRTRLLLGAGALVVAAGVFTTWTRAAPLVAAASALALILTRIRKGGARRLVSILVVLALVGAAVVLAPFFVERVKKSFSGRADWTRLAIWQTALDMASDHPATGVGYGNFQRDAAEHIHQRVKSVGAKRFPGVIAWAHNNLLTFLAETGILGVMAFCLLFVAYFRAAWVTLKIIPEDRHLLRGFVRGSMASVLGFLAVGCFHDTFFDGEVAFTLWFTMGASLAAGRLAAREPIP